MAGVQGMMPTLGRWILDQACQTLAQWRQTCDAVVAVNVDTQQPQDDFAGTVSTVLHQRGVEPEWLIIEVTESAAMDSEAQRELDRVRASVCKWPSTTSGPASPRCRAWPTSPRIS